MRTLTPARLRLHPDRYPWFTSLCFRTFCLHPLNNAPGAAMLCYRPRLGPRLALAAIGRSSDFVQSQQSHQSYSAVSSSYRESPLDSSVYRLSIHFQLLSTSPRGDAVTFGYWRLAPPERDFHPLALTAPKRTGGRPPGLPVAGVSDPSRRRSLRKPTGRRPAPQRQNENC